MKRITWLLGGALALLAVATAACGDDGTATPAATTAPTTAATTTPDDAMMMQPGAENMKVTIQSPAAGAVITENTVTLKVAAAGYDLACNLAGTPDQQGKGHYHIEIDKSLVDMYCTDEATVSLQNVKPGKHTLTVIPAQNDHAEVHENATEIAIDYQPSAPLPEITDATIAGAPSIKIVSPKAGDSVSGDFDVVVEGQNYNQSCDLYGKPAVAGYGHWHLNFDANTGPMMGMGTMAGMSCQTTFHASTAGLAPGSTHTLIATMMDNGHAPLTPEAADKVEVKIG